LQICKFAKILLWKKCACDISLSQIGTKIQLLDKYYDDKLKPEPTYRHYQYDSTVRKLNV